MADLGMDLAATDRPQLVTNILAACVVAPDQTPVDAEEVWSWSVSQRIASLLRIAAASARDFGRLALTCVRAECRQPIEVDLPISNVLALAQQTDTEARLNVNGSAVPLRVRRPTGQDQQRWRQSAFDSTAAARTAVLASLLVSEEASPTEAATESITAAPEVVTAVEATLESLDPLVAFSIQLRCPNCGVDAELPIDLESVALRQLDKIQRQLLQDIHRLATAYHWTEAEIIALSPQRRAHYIGLIIEDAS